MKTFDADTQHKLIEFPTLIDELRKAFIASCKTPGRNKYETSDSGSGLIVMPAWDYRGYLGIKVLTSTPENADRSLPFLQGFYVLFDQKTGVPLVQIEAATLTNYRTAAASALASSFLSRSESQNLLIIGAGSLAPYLIRAHSCVRPIKTIFVWSRNIDNARQIAGNFDGAQVIDDIRSAVQEADIITCATPSTQPLVHGKWLREGQHLDLVGGYKPNMREADDVAIQRSQVFIDSALALEEAGDLIHPMENGLWSRNQVNGDLTELCSGKVPGRTSDASITLFKSVGHALEDIATAAMLWEKKSERV